MKFLEEIIYHLPQDKEFTNNFTTFLSSLGTFENDKFVLHKTDINFLPSTAFLFGANNIPTVNFLFSDGSSTQIEIKNETGEEKTSPHVYRKITFLDFLERMKKYHLVGLDHTGFNLPHFVGIHPRILKLREELKNTCLYHTFPKHLEDAPWDFIIPGTREEIERKVLVDYTKTRKPKIEVVSFDKSSTPLIQIDLQIKERYAEFANDFPEGIHVPEITCVWVYLENSFGIDMCLVLNEAGESDWSFQFAKERL